MIANQLSLTPKQIDSFNRFLVQGTGSTLDALETIFGFSIDSSESSIEIELSVNCENLKHLGGGPLYVVSSAMVGDMQGKVLLLMRSIDFEYLSEVMRPVLSLLFLCSPDSDLEELNKQMLELSQDNDIRDSNEMVFHEQMMDTLAEMGNVIIGLYSKAIYNIYHLNTHHSLPVAMRDPNQQLIRWVLSSSEAPDQPYLVIENEFVVMDRPIKLWCLISPTQESFQDILERIG
jgi:chemotaxis protein CheY-P-specific phosphatase CheC